MNNAFVSQIPPLLLLLLQILETHAGWYKNILAPLQENFPAGSTYPYL